MFQRIIGVTFSVLGGAGLVFVLGANVLGLGNPAKFGYLQILATLVSLATIVVGSVMITEKVVLNRRIREGLTRLVLVLWSLAMAIVLIEIALRFLPLRGIPAVTARYYVWEPHLQAEFNPVSDVMPGIEGTSYFSLNNIGMRGDDYVPQESIYRIVTVGGSTTECLYLDQEETWSRLLEKNLESTNEGQPVWVGNVGRSGHSSWDHVLVFEYLLPQYPDIDVAIVQAGINDSSRLWAVGGSYEQSIADPDSNIAGKLRVTFWSQSGSGLEAFHTFALIRNVSLMAQSPDAIVQDKAGQAYVAWRVQRQNAAFYIDTVPAKLDLALDQYEKNLLAIYNLAGEQDIELVLVTQPYAWSNNASSDEAGLFWFGWYGSYPTSGGNPDTYYTTRVMQQTLDAFNLRMLDFCQTYQVDCVDVAQEMNGDIRYFYDDVHLNELGAWRVAKLIEEHLRTWDEFDGQ